MHFEYFDRYALCKLFIEKESPHTSYENIGFVIKRGESLFVSLAHGRNKNSLVSLSDPSFISEGRKLDHEIIHGWAVLVS